MDFVSVTNNKIMKTVLKSDLYKLVEIGEVEVFTPAQLKSYVEMSNDSISKSEGSKDELYKSVVDEMRSFEPVTMWDDKDLQKSVVMVRPAQIAWDNKGDDIEKSLSGRFLDTELNRKFDRVGLHYPMVDPIEKAKKAVLGEIREWSDGKYRKTAKGWEYIKGSDPKSKSGTELAKDKAFIERIKADQDKDVIHHKDGSKTEVSSYKEMEEVLESKSMFNEYGVHKGYISIRDKKGFTSKPQAGKSIVSQVTTASRISKPEENAYLDKLPVHVMNVVPTYNPGKTEKNYIIETADGEKFLVDTQGYDYPRYISKLFGYQKEEQKPVEQSKKEESQFDKFQIGDTVKLNDDVNLASLSSMKGHNLKVVKLVSGTATVPVFFRVESDMGEVEEINPNYLSKVDTSTKEAKPTAKSFKENVELHDANLAKAKEALKTFSAANGLQDGFNSNSYKKFGSDDVIRSFSIRVKSPNYEDLKAGKVESKFGLSISESQASIPNKYNDKIESVMYDTPNEAFQAGLKFKKKFEEFFNSI